jgi:hypothetical protein
MHGRRTVMKGVSVQVPDHKASLHFLIPWGVYLPAVLWR